MWFTITKQKLSSNKSEQETLISLSDVKWVWKSIVKSWYLFILLPIVFGVVGKFMTYKKVPSYKAQVQILLKSNDVYDYQNTINNNVGIYNVYGDILNQTRILKSYDLIGRSLEKLDLDISYFIVGILILQFLHLGFRIKLTRLGRKFIALGFRYFI